MCFKRASGIIGGLAALVILSGCSHADFEVAIGNRTADTIKVFANGTEMGDVGAGKTASFNVSLRTVNSGPGYGFAPSEQAQVTFSAEDLKTGKLSQAKNWAVSQDRPAYVEFNTWDFLF